MGNSQKTRVNAKRAYFQTLALYGRYHQSSSISVQELLNRHTPSNSRNNTASHNLLFSLEEQASFKELPAEILLHMLTYLNIAEWQMYSIVCKKWREYLHLADYVWFHATQQHFPSLFPQNNKNIKNKTRQQDQQASNNSSPVLLGANYVPPIPLPAALLAMYNNTISNNNNINNNNNYQTTAKTCRQINNHGVASQQSSAWKRLFLNDLIASVAIFNHISCKMGVEQLRELGFFATSREVVDFLIQTRTLKQTRVYQYLSMRSDYNRMVARLYVQYNFDFKGLSFHEAQRQFLPFIYDGSGQLNVCDDLTFLMRLFCEKYYHDVVRHKVERVEKERGASIAQLVQERQQEFIHLQAVAANADSSDRSSAALAAIAAATMADRQAKLQHLSAEARIVEETLQVFTEEQIIAANSDEEKALILRIYPSFTIQQVSSYVTQTQLFDAFMSTFDFSNVFIADAIRLLFSSVRVQGQNQLVKKALSAMSKRYNHNNPKLFAQTKPDAPYAIAFSLLVLNTDMRSPHVKKKMKKEAYRDCLHAIHGEGLSSGYCDALYSYIAKGVSLTS